MELRFPWMRNELLDHLRELADPIYQEYHWLPGQGCLDYIIHFLFDDTPSPRDALGYYLATPQEVDAVVAVIASLDLVLEKYGTKLTDHEYTQKPEWASVIGAAQTALRLIEEKSS